jgi:hypothetical protein
MNRRITEIVSVVILMTALWIWRAEAQSSQPIYPTYQGWIQEADGSKILSFGYVNHNSTPVTIPVGAANSFAPGMPDRGQQITFRPGDVRHACVIMVDSVEDVSKLRWTISYVGKATFTTEIPLNALYLLEKTQEDQVRRGLDRNAPRNSCVNRGPLVSVIRGARGSAPQTQSTELKAKMLQEIVLPGTVQDEGLPRNGKLTSRWNKVSGPGEVTFGNADRATTTATFSAAGTYELALTASDSLLQASSQLKVIVTP